MVQQVQTKLVDTILGMMLVSTYIIPWDDVINNPQVYLICAKSASGETRGGGTV
jgi:hypothetical protein